MKGKRQSSQNSAWAAGSVLPPPVTFIANRSCYHNSAGCCQGQRPDNQASHILGLWLGLKLQLSGLVLDNHTKRRKPRRALVHREPFSAPEPFDHPPALSPWTWGGMMSSLPSRPSPFPPGPVKQTRRDYVILCLLVGFARRSPVSGNISLLSFTLTFYRTHSTRDLRCVGSPHRAVPTLTAWS